MHYHPHPLSKSHHTLRSFQSHHLSLNPHIVAMAGGCGPAGGRIPAHQRTMDSTTPMITAAAGLSEAHQRAIFVTSDQGITVKVRKDYHAWLRWFIHFIFTDYPEIFEHATVLISQEQHDDPVM